MRSYAWASLVFLSPLSAFAQNMPSGPPPGPPPGAQSPVGPPRGAARPPQAPTPGKKKGVRDDTVPFQLNRDVSAASPLAAAARAHVAQGDCKGALPYFDQASAVSIDPTLRRDRGVCNEKLGYPFPAIDDYRAYLTASPNAPDAAQIKERLDALLAQTNPAPADSAAGDKGSASVSASVSVNESGVTTSSRGSAAATTTGATEKDFEQFERDEKQRTDSDASPLRRGTGFIIGPFLWVRNVDLKSEGWGEVVGASLRYAVSSGATVLGDIGYANNNGSGTSTSSAGVSSFLGIEGRFAISPYMTNVLILGGGMGYERITSEGTRLVANFFMPRARLGFRHNVGESLGLEFTVDGGAAYVTIEDIPVQPDKNLFPVVGASLALLIGR